MNSDFADMNAGNITWARIDLYPTVSPNPAFDAAVQGGQSHNVNLLVAVHKTAPSNDLGTEADRAVYRTWLAEMVSRYKHYVKYWEIQNEPNLHYEWNIDESSGSNQAQYEASVLRYVAVLRDGFETIKANDPGATVLFGGLSEWTVERYLDVLLTTEAHQYFDIMAFHPYGSNPDHVLGRFDSFKARMSSNPSYAAKPIWVNELGFNTTWPNLPGKVNSEQQKADYLVQSMSLLYAAGAPLPIFWYTLHENENASGFGLTLKDKQTLQTQYYPAFNAYRDLALGPALTSVSTSTATSATSASSASPMCGVTPTPTPSPTPVATSIPTTTPLPTPTPTPSLTPTPAPSGTAAAGIVIEGASSTVNSTASASLVIAKPAGTAAGEVLVAAIALNGATVAGAPPGWVQIVALTAVSNPKAYAYYHVVGATEPEDYTWTLSSSASASGGIARYTGVNTVTPIDAAVSTIASAAAVSSLTAPGVTTTRPGAMLIGATAINSSNASILITGPSGMTQRWDLGGKRQEYDDGLRPTAGPSGARTWTFSSARVRASLGWRLCGPPRSVLAST
jgi:hypothetical protein